MYTSSTKPLNSKDISYKTRNKRKNPYLETNNDFKVYENDYKSIEIDDESSQIVSFSKSVDKLISGGNGQSGFVTGTVTEVYGLPGVGKTQLCMQMAVNTNIPKIFGGVEGIAL